MWHFVLLRALRSTQFYYVMFCMFCYLSNASPSQSVIPPNQFN